MGSDFGNVSLPLGSSMLAFVLATAAVAGRSSADAPNSIAVPAATGAPVSTGALLRDATLAGLNGPPHRLSDYRHRPLIINVWASWCGPCREEMASLERLSWRPEGQYFAIIGISTDDDQDRAGDFIARTHATLTHFIDRDREMERMLGASRIPLTVLVGADGRVLDKVYGAREWDSAASIALIDTAFRRTGRSARVAPPPPAGRMCIPDQGLTRC